MSTSSCSICFGTGKVKCTSKLCRGNGHYLSPDGGITVCSMCGGKGTVPCECGGLAAPNSDDSIESEAMPTPEWVGEWHISTGITTIDAVFEADGSLSGEGLFQLGVVNPQMQWQGNWGYDRAKSKLELNTKATFRPPRNMMMRALLADFLAQADQYTQWEKRSINIGGPGNGFTALDQQGASWTFSRTGAPSSAVDEYVALGMEECTAAILQDPNNQEAHLARALLYFEQGSIGESLDDFKRVIAIDDSDDNPTTQRARELAAEIAEGLGELNKLLEEAQKEQENRDS